MATPTKKNMRTTLIEAGRQVIKDLLGLGANSEAPKKMTITDIKIEDVQRGKIRLEHRESQILDEMKEVEAHKRKLFEEGVKNASEREQKVIARKILELDNKAKNLDRLLQAVSIQMRVINSFVQIKEQEKMNKEMGIASIFGDVPLEDLIGYMEDAMVDGDLNMKRLQQLARDIEKRNRSFESISDEAEVLDVVRQMQEAREVLDSPEAVDEKFREMENSIKKQEKPAEEEDNLEAYDSDAS